MRLLFFALVLTTTFISSHAQIPAILEDAKVSKQNYLPDFSYAGYKNGTQLPHSIADHVLDVQDFGARPDDGLDDSKALLKTMAKANSLSGNVEIRFHKGKYILSEILYIERSNLVLKGAGSGTEGTILHYPRPLMYLPDPEPLKELREYLVALNKRQKEKGNNIDLPFSQYAWSGGFIWTNVKGERVKSYQEQYNRPQIVLAEVKDGKRGALTITVDAADKLEVGDVVQLEWYNKDGEKGSLIKELYPAENVVIGSHHWNYPDAPLVKQQIRIEQITGTQVTLSSPLLLDANKAWKPVLTEWKHLEHVGIEGFSIEFPISPKIAHHVEMGYNAIYLTRLFDGWVRDVRIKNADSGVLTEEIANVTIENIETYGENIGHYTVQCGGVHNVLAKNITVRNKAIHPLSFNTFSTKSVFTNCNVHVDPILDQHSGANHQNLFDNIKVHISLNGEKKYPLFSGGGAPYWKPSHGVFSTFWNIKVNFKDGLLTEEPIILGGMKDGVAARLIGVHANKDVKIVYGPEAYIEHTNKALNTIPSLYNYQLDKRLTP